MSEKLLRYLKDIAWSSEMADCNFIALLSDRNMRLKKNTYADNIVNL